MRLRVPRCLIDAGRVDLPAADGDGLVTVRLELDGAVVATIAADPEAGGGGNGNPPPPLAITAPVEPHAHLDKTLCGPAFANREGTMAAALAANLREFAVRTAADVEQRSQQALERAWGYGLRAIRSHVDSGPGPAAQASWDTLVAQRQRWSSRLELQLVALVPIQHWLSPEGEELAARVSRWGGLLGGVLGPPYGGPGSGELGLRALLQLAERHGCGIDLHVDESARDPGRGMALVARTALELRPSIPITCSHASSMGLLKTAACERLAERLAAAGVMVVSLPRTNLWLLDRRAGQTPRLRPQAPIRQLQRAGVTVAVGGDNVQDPWYPGGDYDPIDLLRLCCSASHLEPWQRQGITPFTSAAARLLGLSWDGVLRPGCPADLLLLEVDSWTSLLARPPRRRVLRSGVWLSN
jgi:cytosine/creatinine deaminase